MTALDPEFPIECPNCGKTTKKSLSKLKTNNNVTCSCGHTITVNRNSVKVTSNTVGKINKQIMKLGK